MTDFNLIFQYDLSSVCIRHQFCCSFYSLVIHIINCFISVSPALELEDHYRSKKMFKYKQVRRNWVSMYITVCTVLINNRVF